MIRDKITDYGLYIDFAIRNGMLDIDTIQAQAMKYERDYYLSLHKYKVWQAASGYWYTELPPPSGATKRKLVKKKNKEDIENAIIDFYEQETGIPTLTECFYEWTKQKLEYKEVTQSTIERYEQDFKRYFSGSDLEHRRMDKIIEDELESFIRGKIAELNLTAKAFGNMRTVIMGTFKYAKKQKYTQISINSFFGDLDISAKAFAKKVKKPQVFKDDEKELIIKWLKENPSIENYGLLLTFQTGMRTCELAAVKYSDISGRWMHVHSMEIKYRSPEDNKYVCEVVEYVKTEAGDRQIALPTSALDTIQRIKQLNPNGTYLMEKDGKKFKKTVFNRRLYKACEECGIAKKSMHKVRKTYGTNLIDSGADDIFVIRQMGHTDINTTRNHYYDLSRTKDVYLQEIDNAISV